MNTHTAISTIEQRSLTMSCVPFDGSKKFTGDGVYAMPFKNGLELFTVQWIQEREWFDCRRNGERVMSVSADYFDWCGASKVN
jgi:hypothetical protein